MKRKPLYLAVLVGIAFATPGVVLRADDETAHKAHEAARGAQASANTSPAKSDHWSYQSVAKPAVPQVQNQNWVRTPIDAFILKDLEAKGISPSEDADRALLARRLSLDVLGYIPAPDEVEAFVSDSSPDAYEKLVDKLLSSEHYGERQARRWLDLARYADSSGFENDTNRLNMWRYRDYVINAFNDDKPFDRFIQEQLAGDELWPGDENALIATGFMAHYPDNRNSRDMVQRHYQIVTDITDTVGEVILGQTFECARCHDHKFDSISQKEYFSLQSFFANVNEVSNIPVTHKTVTDLAYEKATAEYDAATKDIRGKIDAIVQQDRDAALVYHKERYLTDTRDAIFKPEREWTALDRWINHRLATVTNTGALINYFGEKARSTDPNFYSKWHEEKNAELEALDEELKQFNKLKPALELGSNEISAMTELGHADAPPTFVLFGGDHERPLDEVQPGFPAAITDAQPAIEALPFSSGRRAALATWLTSEENPLTARVYVNRVWDQYFGRGIVETVSNFGKAGVKPTHPELLDYLASHFVEEGWSVKKLHREILLSSVYRQSSAEREDVLQADPENRLLGVFPHRRLEAEQIRDSLLVASGNLQDKLGGPSVLPPLPKTGQTGGYRNLWTESTSVEDQNRRSLYIFTRRSLPYPLLDVFNMASSQEAHSKREITTTPLQALTLFNSELVYDWSRTLAGRVINEANGAEQQQFDELYRILFARTPTVSESRQLENFLDEQEKVITERSSAEALAASLPQNLEQGQLQPARVAAFVDLVHTVVNSNEFIHRF